MAYKDFEPPEPQASDLIQIEAYDRGLTSDPGCWTQSVEFREREKNIDTEEADRYDAWLDALYEAHCKELGLNPETGEPGESYTGPTWWAEWDQAEHGLEIGE